VSAREEILGSIARRDTRSLKSLLAGTSDEVLASLWDGFQPLERLICHKMMTTERATVFSAGLSAAHRYELYLGADLGAAAPFIEGLSEEGRASLRTIAEAEREALVEVLRENS